MKFCLLISKEVSFKWKEISNVGLELQGCHTSAHKVGDLNKVASPPSSPICFAYPEIVLAHRVYLGIK